MHAGHTFNRQNLFHGFFFLFSFVIPFILRSDGRSALFLTLVKLQSPQPQRVADHADRAHAHRRRAQHGAQLPAQQRIEHARRDRDADGVIPEGPKQVLLDVADHRAGQANGCGHIAQIGTHQHDIGAVHSDISTRTNGKPHVCTG